MWAARHDATQIANGCSVKSKAVVHTESTKSKSGGYAFVELKKLIKVLWHWSWVVVLNMLLAGMAAYLVSQRMEPIYQSSTLLLINQAPINSAGLDFNTVRSTESLANTYAEIVLTRPVLEVVIADLQLNTNPGRLAKNITVSSPADTQLLELTARASDPQLAAAIANTTVRVFIRQHQERQALRYAVGKASLEQELEKLRIGVETTQARLSAFPDANTAERTIERNQLQVLLAQQRDSYTAVLKSLEEVRLAEAQTTATLNVVEPAYAPFSPVLPNTKLNIAIAAILAATGIFVLALLIESLNDRVRTSEDVERLLGVPALAALAGTKDAKLPDRIAAFRDTRSATAEVYRMLRAKLLFCTLDRPLRTIVVTSRSPREGKSTTIANLAATFSQTGMRVMLVDADLRRPTLHTFFKQANDRGVTTALFRDQDEPLTDHFVSSGIDNVWLMPSGPIPPNPAELLGSTRMNALIEELKLHADVVLFDSPPLLPVVDASLLAHQCDATLLVVMAHATRSDALVKVRDQLLQSRTYLLGVVLTGVSNASPPYYLAPDTRLGRYSRRWHNLRLRFFPDS